MEKNSFVLYTDYIDALDDLDMAQRGLLFTAIMKYSNGQELPQLDPATKMAFNFIKKQLDKDAEKWEDIKAKRVQAGSKGGKQKVANQANATFDKQKVANQAVNVNVNVNDNVIDNLSVYNEPTEQEIKNYCKDKNLNKVNPIDFYKYYESKRWMVNGEHIKDWRKLVEAVNRNSRAKTKPNAGFMQRDYDFEELEKEILNG